MTPEHARAVYLAAEAQAPFTASYFLTHSELALSDANRFNLTHLSEMYAERVLYWREVVEKGQ